METFWAFNEPKQQNWFRGVVALTCLEKSLVFFIDEETEKFHRELQNECGADPCVNNCDFKSWKPRPNEKPPLDCEVCCPWRDAIWDNHTSQRGKVMWLNCKPHLWSQNKWEVAKVYMPCGHKDHSSVEDFDIASLLCLMTQCKHFKKFELGDLCEKVSCVRNKICHAPKYQLEQEDLHNFLIRIRDLGETLARHDPEFTSMSEDIDQIQSLEYKLDLPENMAADIEALKAQYEKELNDKIMAIAQEAAAHCLTKMKLENLERRMAQQDPEDLHLEDYYALTHIPRGLCVVINNEEFLGTGLGRRRGTQEDAKALRTVFTRLGFTVVIHENLTAERIRHELQELGKRDFLYDDALVVCVLTHGDKGCVFGTDEREVSLRELTLPFTSWRTCALAGKPKLFFIQACQGSNYQRGPISDPQRQRLEEDGRVVCLEEDASSSERGEMMPCDADFLLGMATVAEFKTFRNTTTGSIYIQELCRQLTRSAASSEMDDILTVLTRVNRQVGKGNYLNHKQMPEPKYTLTKKLVLKFV
ncbi:caspase-8-like [Centropristis striata]|uniref:caspase-8-like n=1 Tax=Centropristis striata TaxID=184440 RepID=UPI0027E15A0D|nr:caspase-8-like [Centropristis striata]